MAPEKLTEKFFEFKGWKYKEIHRRHQMVEVWPLHVKRPSVWYVNDTYDNYPYGSQLPPLHTSLDLQEEWLWPELHKVDLYKSVLYEMSGEPKHYFCILERGKLDGEGKTKAIAQLTAGLKALGVEV